MTARTGRRGGAVALAALGLVLVAGCAANSSADRADRESLASLPPLDRLQARAERELDAPPRADAAQRSMPVPPGVEAEALAPATDPIARLDLDATLAAIAEAAGPARIGVPEAPGPAAPGDAVEALRFYLLGRDAALQGDHLAAIRELEQAVVRDPEAPAIWRALAGSLARVGNAARTQAAWAQVHRLAPDDLEAAFELALNEMNRRDFDAALLWVARAHVAGADFDADPVRGRLVRYLAHVALRRTGRDRAAIEAGLAAIAEPLVMDVPPDLRPRLASMYRQRAEILRSCGDAACRLGAWDEAIEAYAAASDAPLAGGADLAARRAWAALRRGAEAAAMLVVAEPVALLSGEPAEEFVALVRWMAPLLADRAALADVVAERSRERPAESATLRMLALLRPDAGTRERLERLLAGRPGDALAVGSVLEALAAADREAAIDLATRLVVEHPEFAESTVRSLIRAIPDPIRAATNPDAPASPAAAELEARLQAEYWMLGRAWWTVDAALAAWPDDVGLRRLRIELAGRLDERPLLDEALAGATTLRDPWTSIVRARALRGTEQIERAIAAADEARRAAGDGPFGVAARVELAEALAARADGLSPGSDRAQVASAAVDAAEDAIDLDPARDEPWAMLARLWARPGPEADVDRTRELLRALDRRTGSDRLLQRLLARLDLAQGRAEPALERGLGLVAIDPADADAMGLVVSAWEELKTPDRAEAWLLERLAARPDDPALWDQLARLMLRTARSRELEALLVARPPRSIDPIVDAMRELAATATGDHATAWRLGRARLERRPVGTRRELQIASLAASAGLEAEALRRLDWLADHADRASLRHLMAAIGIAGQLPEGTARRDAAVARLAEAADGAFTDVPIPIYAIGLRALTRIESGDGTAAARFDALARRAARRGHGADDGTMRGVLPWRALAQRLADDGRPDAAAAALRARFEEASELDLESMTVLTSMILSADAATGDGAEQSLSHLRAVVERNRRAIAAGLAETTIEFADACFEASQIYASLGTPEDTERILRTVLAERPDMAMAKNNLGYALLVAGRLDAQARQWIEEAGVASPEDASVLDTVGWLRYCDGRFLDDEEGPGAVTLLERAEALSDSPSAEMLLHLGDAFWRAGRTDPARRAWEAVRAILEDPAFREERVTLYRRIQSQVWGLEVVAPEAIYDRDFAGLLEGARARLERLDAGAPPPVAPTFAEAEAMTAVE